MDTVPNPPDTQPVGVDFGEIVDIHITGAIARSMLPDGSQLFELGGRHLHIDPMPGVKVERVTPADGPPQPADLWADAEGTTYVAVARGSFVLFVGILPPDDGSNYVQWADVHKGPHGPIRLVHRPETWGVLP